MKLYIDRRAPFKHILETMEMAQWLQTLTALLEDQASIYTSLYLYLFETPMPGYPMAPEAPVMPLVHRYTSGQNIYNTQNKIIKHFILTGGNY